MGDSICNKCGAPCPQDIMENGMCGTCAKSQTEPTNNTGPRFCQNEKCGAALRPCQKSRYCDVCDKARQAKWVTQDSLDRKLKEAQDRAAEQQAKLLKDFQQSLFAQLASGGKAQATITSAQGLEDTSQNPPDLNTETTSGQEQEALDYDETRSMWGKDHGHFDSNSVINSVTPSDSVSQVGTVASHRSGSSTIDRAIPERVEMIQRISDLVEPGEQVTADIAPDAMKKAFGNNKAYDLQNEKKKGISLSSVQKELLDKHLYPKSVDSVPAFSSADTHGIPVEEEHFHYFKSPQPNKELLDYISIVRQRDDGSDKATPLTSKTVYKHNPTRRACEHELYRIDQAARVGLKYTVYSQWVGTAMKMLMAKELGPDHPLVREGSEFNKMFDELFLSSHIASKQFCNVATMSVGHRRKMILEELHLQPHVLKSCNELPMDRSGIHLFGDQGKEGDEAMNLERIISHYGEKVSSVRKFASAFKPSPKSQKSGSKRPASETRESSEKRRKVDHKRSDHRSHQSSHHQGSHRQQGTSSDGNFRRPSGFPPKSRSNQGNRSGQGRF